MLLLPMGLLAPGLVATATLLLDQVATPVTAAYGLRRLRGGYAGPAIRVRRSTDNAEADIALTAGHDLDTTALLTFCGSGSGYVSKWYDQTGVGLHVIQVTASNQPQIVNAGAVLRMGNATARPAVVFSQAAKTMLMASAVPLAGANTTCAAVGYVQSIATLNARLFSYRAPADSVDYNGTNSCCFGLYGPSDKSIKAYCNGFLGLAFSYGNPFQMHSIFKGTTHSMFIDGATDGASGTLSSNGISLTTGGTFQIGSFGPASTSGDYLDGSMSEVVLTSGSLSAADQAAIRASQKSYYGTP